MPSAIPLTGWLKTSTSPSLGGSRPEMRASVVDLPHPVGPTTAQNSPGCTAMSRSRRAVKTSPEGVRNRFVTPRSSMAAVIFPTLADPAAGRNLCGRCGRFGRFGRGGHPWGRLRSRGNLLVKTRLPLAYQILAFQVAIILLSALMGAAAALWQARQELDRQYEQRSLAIAESVASNPAIQGSLLAGRRGGP